MERFDYFTEDAWNRLVKADKICWKKEEPMFGEKNTFYDFIKQ